MYRITTSDRVVDKFGAGKDGFSDGDPMVPEDGTTLDAGWHDRVQEELCRQIEYWGWTPTIDSNFQVQRAMGSGLLGVLEAVGDPHGTRFQDLQFDIVPGFVATIAQDGKWIVGGRYVELSEEYLTESGFLPYNWTPSSDHWFWLNPITWDLQVDVTTYDNPNPEPAGYVTIMRFRTDAVGGVSQDYNNTTAGSASTGFQIGRLWRFRYGAIVEGLTDTTALTVTGSGTGNAIVATGGANGSALVGAGGSSSGYGLSATNSASITARASSTALELYNNGLASFGLLRVYMGTVNSQVGVNIDLDGGATGQFGYNVSSGLGSPDSHKGFRAYMLGEGVGAYLRSASGHSLQLDGNTNKAHIETGLVATIPTVVNVQPGHMSFYQGAVDHPHVLWGSTFNRWRYLWHSDGPLESDASSTQSLFSTNVAGYFSLGTATITDAVVGAGYDVFASVSYGALNLLNTVQFELRVNGAIAYTSSTHIANVAPANTVMMHVWKHRLRYYPGTAGTKTVELFVQRGATIDFIFARDRSLSITGGYE